MHFWIDKRASSYQYGRRRPTFYSSGTFTNSSFGRERRNRTLRSVASTSSTPTPTTSHRGSLDRQFAPRHYYYASHNHHNQGRPSPVPPRRPSTTYRQIPDPAIRQALDELDAELRITFPSPVEPECRPNCFSSKRIGLCLCFMGFILLCTVAGKFIVEGPGIIDASRRSALAVDNDQKTSPSISFFFISEVIFVAFALGLFFVGVTCLRKRTNQYLLRQFRQHIINSHLDESSNDVGTEIGRRRATTLISMSQDTGAGNSVDLESGTLTLFPDSRRGSRSERRVNGYLLDNGTNLGHSGRRQRGYNYSYGCQQLVQSKPPPYEVALYLPLPNQQVPHHTVTNSNFPGIQPTPPKEENGEKCDCPGVVVSPSRTETPPPSYELQFSYEI